MMTNISAICRSWRGHADRVLSFHDVAKAALRAVNFENKLLKQTSRTGPKR